MTRHGCSHHYRSTILNCWQQSVQTEGILWLFPNIKLLSEGKRVRWLISPNFGLNYGNLQKTGQWADLLLLIGNQLNMWLYHVSVQPDLFLCYFVLLLSYFKVNHFLCVVVIFPASLIQDYLCGSKFKQKWRAPSLKCWLMALFASLEIGLCEFNHISVIDGAEM